MTQVSLPPPTISPLAGDAFSPIWRRFLEGVWRRTGASGDITISATNLTVAITSNTNLRFTYVGSDGVTRTADVTLS